MVFEAMSNVNYQVYLNTIAHPYIDNKNSTPL